MSSALRIPPSRESLTRFLEQRRARSIEGAARLLGWTPLQVRQRAMDEDVLRPGALLPWTHVASWLVEAWPLRVLFDSLGDAATLLPVGLQLTPVTWELPYYIAHAMRVQAALETMPHRTLRPETQSEYMRDLLHRAIDVETVAVLRSDREFMAAFEFPFEQSDP
jgi:hypothetical protein